MIRINQIKLPIHHNTAQLEQKIRKLLNVAADMPLHYQIVKKSIDARKKPELCYVYSVDVKIAQETKVLKKIKTNNVTAIFPKKYRLQQKRARTVTPIIAGAGPAGLFCAYALMLQGFCPVVVERGKSIEARTLDVAKFWETGILNTNSNVQFGEGGAGTFSDGKLNTLVKDTFGRNQFVLETFVKFGAPERILYENKPHIGTDILSDVIKRMRNEMKEQGVTFLFETCVTDFKTDASGTIREIQLNGSKQMAADCLVLAIGHSARDTFSLLQEKGLSMQAKSFAVGFRVEHPQSAINLAQYGSLYADELSAASYKTTASSHGRGVYSFCMCPGGYVVNASSEEKRLAVNGMSYSDRGSKNANSAIIVSVTPQDFMTDDADALSGVRFQQQLEERAWQLGGGKIPQQLFGDYYKNQPSVSYGAYESVTKGASVLCNLRGLLPQVLEDAFIEGMHHFSHTIFEFDRPDAILSGVESRTSSPVRIERDETLQSNIRGIYPCGEGAGYAGGIMSAAMDGLKVAEAIAANNENR